MRNDILAVSTVLPDGTRATFRFLQREAPHWVAPTRPYQRGYVSGSRAQYNAKPRMYVSTSGKESLLENLMNRTTRPVNVWGKLCRQAMAQLGFTGKIGWYAKAGCSCPCSPGFIWSDAPLVEGTSRYDVWVTLEGAPIVRDDEAAQFEQLHRLGAMTNDPTLPLEAMAGTRL